MASSRAGRVATWVVLVVVLVAAEVLRCGRVGAEVVTFGQEFDDNLDLLLSNRSRNIFLIYKVPEDGILYQMSAYFMTNQSMFLQVWRPAGDALEFELIHARQYSVDDVNQVKVLDTVRDPTQPDPECPELSAGDWLGLYSSGHVPIPYYRDAGSEPLLHRISDEQPAVGQKLVFRELRPAARLRFVAQFSLATDDTSEERGQRRAQHGRRRTGYSRMCVPRNRVMPDGMSMRRTSRSPRVSTFKPYGDEVPMEPNSPPPGGSTLRPNGGEMPMVPSSPPPGGSTLRPSGGEEQLVKPSSRPPGGSTSRSSGDDKVGDAGEEDTFYSEHEKRSRKGNTETHENSGVTSTEMYIIIGSLAFVVVAVVVAIIVCVGCRRNKRQAEPRSPVPPAPLDVAMLRMSKHMAAVGDCPRSSPEPRYTSDGRLRPKVQKLQNEYLDLRTAEEPPDEVYEEIRDPDEEVLEPVRGRLALPERRDPSTLGPPRTDTTPALKPASPGLTGRNSRIGRSAGIEPSGSGSPKIGARIPSKPSRPYSPGIDTGAERNPSGSGSPMNGARIPSNPSGSGSPRIDSRNRPSSLLGSRPLGVQHSDNEHTYLGLVG